MAMPCAQMITFREFDKDDARKWFPISFLLVLVIYTGSKALVSLPFPAVVAVCNIANTRR